MKDEAMQAQNSMRERDIEKVGAQSGPGIKTASQALQSTLW